MSRGTWHGDWRNRLVACAERYGCDSLLEFLRRNPGVPYTDIARMFGDDVAPIQVIAVAYSEAKKSRTTRAVAMDSLCRNIREHLPDGWGVGDDSDFNAAMALAGWSSEVVVTGQNPEYDHVVDKVVDLLRFSPIPNGWLPSSGEDPRIVQAFLEGWPTSADTTRREGNS